MSPRERLQALVAAGEIPLDEGVVCVTRDEAPEVEAAAVFRDLDELAGAIRMPSGADTVQAVARINQHLFGTLGFAGDEDTYDDPINSRLDRVLIRRKGLPILLSVVYMEVARRCGLEIEGVGFPGHFLVRPAAADPAFYVDPFNGGRVLRPARLRDRLERMARGAKVSDADFARFTSAVDARYILIRINNNLKGAWLRRSDLAGALRAVERLLILAPELHEERRDRGMLRARTGDTAGAIVDLFDYLEAVPNAPERAQIERELAKLGAIVPSRGE